MIIVVSVLAGIVPMIVYPWFLYFLDRYEKEPIPLLVATFLWGFVPAAIHSLISQLILSAPFYLIDETGATAELFGSVLFAPVTEEIFKGFAVLLLFLLWKHEFDGVFDGIIYGSLVGFGFAAIENILYFSTAAADIGSLIVMRAFVFGLNHALFTSLTGIGFGVARHSRSALWRIIAPFLGLIGAIILHGIHNFTVTFAGDFVPLLCVTFISNYGGVMLVLATILLAVQRERQWLIDGLKDEVYKETLSDVTYSVVTHPLRRYAARFSALTRGGVRSWWRLGGYYHLLTELAFKTHARIRRGDQGASESQIEFLRGKARLEAGNYERFMN